MPSSTHISTVGEFGLVDRLREIVESPAAEAAPPSDLLIGIGDDAALFRPRAGRGLLLTADAFVEGIHFDLAYTSFLQLGWKTIAANLSDIAAMGGEPGYAIVTLALPSKISVEMMEDLYRGARHACTDYGCRIVGGDTSASLGNMMISIAMTGDVEIGKELRRDAARPGELLCVSGTCGGAHAGLRILAREKRRFLESGARDGFQPNLEPYKEVIERHLVPRPRFDVARALVDAGVRAAIDVSDGIASDARRIAEASHVGLEVVGSSLPLLASTRAAAAEFAENPAEYALFGGEDYEILFAVGDDGLRRLREKGVDVTVIGRIVDAKNGLTFITGEGERVALPPRGWDHFMATENAS